MLRATNSILNGVKLVKLFTDKAAIQGNLARNNYCVRLSENVIGIAKNIDDFLGTSRFE